MELIVVLALSRPEASVPDHDIQEEVPAGRGQREAVRYVGGGPAGRRGEALPSRTDQAHHRKRRYVPLTIPVRSQLNLGLFISRDLRCARRHQRVLCTSDRRCIAATEKEA